MKRFLYTLAAFAIFATSCVNNNLGDTVLPENKVTISVEALGDDTRTYVENDQVFWSESGEQLNIIYYADDNNSSRRQSGTHTDYTVAENRATFTADFSTTDGATTYTFGAFSPYSYKYSTSLISLTVPQDQTPTESSYDKAADILVSKNPVTTTGLPNAISFAFARMVALVKMTLVGIEPGEKIEKVVFSSPAKPNGAVEFSVHTSGTLENAKWYNNYEDTNINLGGRVATGEDVVWFTTVPTDLSGSSFTVTVTTETNIYTKTVDLTGKTLNFERANIAKFTVKDLAIQEKPKAYTLLTDISELTVGDEVVLCTKSYASSSARLLSATLSGSSYLAYSSIFTINDDNTITELPKDGVVFTVEKGTLDNTFALKSANGYLYRYYDSAAYSNKLTFSDTKNDDTSWEISLKSGNVVQIYNAASYYYVNNNTSSSRFQLSYSANSIYMWYVNGTSSEGGEGGEEVVTTPLATPVVTATASGNSISVSWEAVDGAKDYTVTCGSQSLTVEFTGATFNELEYETTYEISVVANPSNSSLNSASEAGTASATTEKAPEQGDTEHVQTVTFPIEGAVSGEKVGTITVGDITITSTGTWRVVGPNADWSGIYMGYSDTITFGVVDQSKHEITKIEITAESGGSLNFGSAGSGNSVTWEPGYGTSSKTFTASSATRVASATVYYRNK